MYNYYRISPCPYCVNTSTRSSVFMYNPYNPYSLYNPYDTYNMYPYPYYFNTPMYNPVFFNEFTEQYIPFTDEMRSNSQFNSFQPSEEDTVLTELKDYGPEPLAININEATKENDTFRTALWTGTHLQVTLMSIDVNDDIGLEIHPEIDQFIRIEEGEGLVKMGSTKDLLDFEAKVSDDFAFMIPAGTWHNIINTGDKPLKAYSIYAPPQHPQGTVHETKADAQAAEESKETVQSPE